MKRLYDLANLSLLLLIGLFVYTSYPRLPARIPMHFNLAGRPDRWDGRGGIVVLAGLALVMTLALYAVIWLTPRLAKNSRYVNIPRKQQFLLLPAEKQESYWQVYKDFFAALALAINLLFYLILRGMVRIATGAAGLLPFKAMLPAFALMAVVLVYYTWRLIALPGRLIRGDE
jgi:uncharacterized membrane protein